MLLHVAMFLAIVQQAAEAWEPVLVQALFRHGDRRPKLFFPNDPANGYFTWYSGNRFLVFRLQSALDCRIKLEKIVGSNCFHRSGQAVC